MARPAQWVLPGLPHHVTQRGSRRQRTSFTPDDFVLYRELLAHHCAKNGVAIWAYCLMPNHVHLIAVPEREAGLGAAIGRAHRSYSQQINRRQGWSGALWQGRFVSTPMDERHLMAAARYVELNPLRAGLVDAPAAYPWSSARAHLTGRDDDLVRVRPLADRVADWADYLAAGIDEEELTGLRRHLSAGWPLGGAEFLQRLRRQFARPVAPARRGRSKPAPSS